MRIAMGHPVAGSQDALSMDVDTPSLVEQPTSSSRPDTHPRLPHPHNLDSTHTSTSTRELLQKIAQLSDDVMAASHEKLSVARFACDLVSNSHFYSHFSHQAPDRPTRQEHRPRNQRARDVSLRWPSSGNTSRVHHPPRSSSAPCYSCTTHCAQPNTGRRCSFRTACRRPRPRAHRG